MCELFKNFGAAQFLRSASSVRAAKRAGTNPALWWVGWFPACQASLMAAWSMQSQPLPRCTNNPALVALKVLACLQL